MRKAAMLVLTLAILTVAGKVQAAVEVTCRNKDGSISTVSIPQKDDPICDQFQCEEISAGQRYEDVAARYDLTTSQLIHFAIPEGKGTSEHRSGTSPNLVVGYTVVGEFPNWTHLANADLCIDTVEKSNARRKPGKNLQWAMRHNLPRAVVVIPAEPDPCLLGHAQCTAAYKADHAVVTAVMSCKGNDQLFDPASGTCVPRVSTEQIALANTAAAAKACHIKTNHRFDYDSEKCAAIGIVTKVPRWAWAVMAALALVVLCLIFVPGFGVFSLRRKLSNALTADADRDEAKQAMDVVEAMVFGRQEVPLKPENSYRQLVDRVRTLVPVEAIRTALETLVQMVDAPHNGDTSRRLLTPDHPLYTVVGTLHARVVALKKAACDWTKVVHDFLIKLVDMEVIEIPKMPETPDQARLNLGVAARTLEQRLAVLVDAEPDGDPEGDGAVVTTDRITREMIAAITGKHAPTLPAAQRGELNKRTANRAFSQLLEELMRLTGGDPAASTA